MPPMLNAFLRATRWKKPASQALQRNALRGLALRAALVQKPAADAEVGANVGDGELVTGRSGGLRARWHNGLPSPLPPGWPAPIVGLPVGLARRRHRVPDRARP